VKLDCKNPGKALAVFRVEIFKELIDVATVLICICNFPIAEILPIEESDHMFHALGNCRNRFHVPYTSNIHEKSDDNCKF
jgi:hypothetical protein